MRKLMIAAILAAGPAFAGDLVATQGRDSVRLTQEPCHPAVLRVIPQGERGYYRKAVVLFEGKSWVACWAPLGDQKEMVHLWYSDADQGLIPRDQFREEPDA